MNVSNIHSCGSQPIEHETPANSQETPACETPEASTGHNGKPATIDLPPSVRQLIRHHQTVARLATERARETSDQMAAMRDRHRRQTKSKDKQIADLKRQIEFHRWRAQTAEQRAQENTNAVA